MKQSIRSKILTAYATSFVVLVIFFLLYFFFYLKRSYPAIAPEFWTILVTATLFLFFGFIAILLLTGALLSKWVLDPLQDLSRVTDQFASGDFREKLHLEPTDELGMLSRHLNQMAHSLEAQLRDLTQGKSQLETVLANMEEGVMVTDRHREILLMNEAFKVLFQTSLPVKPRTVLEHLRNVELEDSLKTAVDKGTRMTRELVLDRKPPVILEMNTSPILVSGKIRGIVAVFHDITEMRRAENEQRDFIQNASHELRTPLTVIKGYVEELLEGPLNEPVRIQKHLEVLKKNADRLETLVSDILDLSRIESRKEVSDTEPLDIRRPIEQLLEELQSRARQKEIRLLKDISGKIPPVLMTELHFIQALSNLMDNAIKYSGSGASVTVRALPKDGIVRVEVEDQGIGISEEERQRIFERFYRVDKDRSRASGGTGLGLSIVRSLVEKYGGTVGLRSKVGEGSCFYFDLPTGNGRS